VTGGGSGIGEAGAEALARTAGPWWFRAAARMR